MASATEEINYGNHERKSVDAQRTSVDVDPLRRGPVVGLKADCICPDFSYRGPAWRVSYTPRRVWKEVWSLNISMVGGEPYVDGTTMTLDVPFVSDCDLNSIPSTGGRKLRYTAENKCLYGGGPVSASRPTLSARRRLNQAKIFSGLYWRGPTVGAVGLWI